MNSDDNFDEAIDFLRKVDISMTSYFEECASLLEELVGRLQVILPSHFRTGPIRI